jgi:riboflavin synthase
MFTGIIEEIGTISHVKSLGGGIQLRVQAPQSAGQLHVNDSVSINGVCQTVVWRDESAFDVVAVEETLKKTTFGSLRVGMRVNLELPLKLDQRLGGHLLLGHVDTVGRITDVEQRETSWMFSVEFPNAFARYIVPTGSIAVDGVSLTVAELGESNLRVSIIPHTMEKTIFASYRKSDAVNLEFDVIGKYVERLVSGSTDDQTKKFVLTEKDMREMGY